MEHYCLEHMGLGGQPANCRDVRCDACPNRDKFIPKKADVQRLIEQYKNGLARQEKADGVITTTIEQGVPKVWHEDRNVRPGGIVNTDVLPPVVIKMEPGSVNGSMDKVMHPNHYSRWKMEPIEFIAINDLPWWLANVIKYTMRYDAKDGLQDLYKGRSYLDMKIRQIEGTPRFWDKPVAEERKLNGKREA